MSCRLTVLMTVYNGARYLRTAIDSILQQTYRDFHFLIVDDGSTDDTRDIVRSYDDERIELLCLDRNVGQTAALNIGLRRGSTPWIARMDADDYSAPTRLEEQMRALDTDRSLSCVGTFAWEFRDNPQVVEATITKPEHYADIERALLQGSPIIHGSIVVSRTALLDVGAYNERYRYSADLELYDRLLARYRAANISRRLLGIRRHHNQGSFSKTAADEKIEIFSRMLSTNNCSHEDIAIVRASLIYSYFFRARCLGVQGRYVELLNDLLCAVRLSPKTFFRVFVASLIPKRVRTLLRTES